jgi:hypothetical protein
MHHALQTQFANADRSHCGSKFDRTASWLPLLFTFARALPQQPVAHDLVYRFAKSHVLELDERFKRALRIFGETESYAGSQMKPDLSSTSAIG